MRIALQKFLLSNICNIYNNVLIVSKNDFLISYFSIEKMSSRKRRETNDIVLHCHVKNSLYFPRMLNMKIYGSLKTLTTFENPNKCA